MVADLLPVLDRALAEERAWRRSPFELLHAQAGTPSVFEPLVPHYRYKAAYGGRSGSKSHFFADLAIKRETDGAPDAGILPECAAVIFDEAHELEDVAGSYFGVTVSTARVEELARDLEHAV